MQLGVRSVRPRPQAQKKQPLNPPPQRKLYTIHLKEKHHPFVFHIQEEMDTPSSCYLVSFENVTMTKQMIQLIKTHYALHGDWPSTNISPEEPLDLTLPDEAPEVTDDALTRVPTIWILSWSETELDNYAQQKRLNLFEIRTDQTVRMYRFEYDLETLQTHLEKSLEI